MIQFLCFGMLLLIASLPLLAQDFNISGRVINTDGKAISGASVKLETAGVSTTTSADGRFLLTRVVGIFDSGSHEAWSSGLAAIIHNGFLSINIAFRSDVSVISYSLEGKALSTMRWRLDAGHHAIVLKPGESGIHYYRIKTDFGELILKAFSISGGLRSLALPVNGHSSPSALMKPSAVQAAFKDKLIVTKEGYLDFQLSITDTETSGLEVRLKEKPLEKFSFFVTSLKAMRELSGSMDGFGGDLRFGETGKGAGLRGADKICATIAERSMPGSSSKVWRAFLSVTEDENGQQVNAIDRVGKGPWYDRLGRLLAPTVADLKNTRPENGDSTIKNNLPNEDGVPNKQPDPYIPYVDNKHFITGSNTDGTLFSQDATCKDWTTSDGTSGGRPQGGFSWPRPIGSFTGNGTHWISGWTGSGCAPGIELEDKGEAEYGANYIGAGGGYGGFYCFALSP